MALCAPCRRLLYRTTARPLRVERHARHAAGLPIVAAGAYEHELATCILAMKQAGRTDLVPVLAPVLGRALRSALGTQGPSCPVPVELVGIPSSARALRRRWYDPVEELLAACRRSGHLTAHVRVTPWLVHRSRDPGANLRDLPGRLRPGGGGPGAQKTLSADQRLGTGQQRFRVAPGRRMPGGVRAGPGTVVLIDDVVTTGATLAQARRSLEAAGAEVLGAVVLAAANTPGENRRNQIAEEADQDEFAV